MDALLIEIITSVIQYPGLTLAVLRYFVPFSSRSRRFLGSNVKNKDYIFYIVAQIITLYCNSVILILHLPMPVAARRSAATRLLRLWLPIPPKGASVVCCQVEVSATS